jgi:hypothetical protein
MRTTRGDRKLLVIEPELSIATCGQTLIPLSTAQVRMLVALARHAPLDGCALSSAAELSLTALEAHLARLRERFAAAELATLLAEQNGRYVLTGEVWIARRRLKNGRIVLERARPGAEDRALSPFGFTVRHQRKLGMSS